MNIQLKYSFKKEIAYYFRRHQFLAMLLSVFGFAVANPLMYKATAAMFNAVEQLSNEAGSSFSADVSMFSGDFGVFGSASMMLSMCLMNFATYSLLIVMLVMRNAAGGEQKKRAMIVPICGGLNYKSYLLPKFIIYPLSMFALTFLGGELSGGLCNALFENDKVDAGMMSLGSLFMAVYVMFIITVYLSLGLCSSRPGIMVAVVFLGQTFLSSFLDGLKLTDYHPFSLVSITSAMFNKDFVLSEKTPSILTAIALSLVICVLMYFLALGVLNAKKIDNQEEEKPVF